MPNWKKVIVSGSDAALNSLIVTNGITGSLLGTASTASFVTGSDVHGPYGSNSVVTASYAFTASISQATTENRILVLNQSGNTIAKGLVVHITASGNSSDTPRVITASYENDNNSANTLGITSETIANGSTGYVTTEGVLTGINTSAFTSGQLVYLGSAGSIIGSAPVAPLHSVRLGQVVREQAINGSIYVRVDNGYELGELHDVRDTSTTSSYGDLLVKSGSVWINSKQLTGSYGLTGSLTATSFTGSLLGTASYATTAGSTTAISGTDNYIPRFNGSSALENSVMYDDGTNIGIGTTTPYTRLNVEGTVITTGTLNSTAGSYSIDHPGINTWKIGVTNTNSSTLHIGNDTGGSFANKILNITAAGNVGIGTTSPQNYSGFVTLTVGDNSGSKLGLLKLRSNYNGGDGFEMYQNSSGLLYLNTNSGTTVMNITAVGNIGIGTSSPPGNSTNRALEIVGTDSSNLVVTQPGYATAAFTSYNNEAYIGTSTNHPFYMYTSGSERLRIATNGALKFNAYGSGTFTGTATQKLAVDSSGNVIEIPIGAGPVDGSGTANYITRWVDTDTITTSSIYETGGNIGIGTTSPGSLLQVGSGESTTDALIRLGVSYAGDRTSRGGISWRDGSDTTGKIYTEYDGTMTSMVFGSLYNSGYTTNQTMIIRGNGNVGIGTTTPAYKLSVVGKIALNDGGDSVFIGNNAGLSDDATANVNVGIGTNALQTNISGSGNVAVGSNALQFSTAPNNTAVGNNASRFTTTGFSNTSLGSFALWQNLDGIENTGLGTTALLFNTSGSGNTGVGTNALRANTSGSNNTGVGVSALSANILGNDNVAIGRSAGRFFGTGTSNNTSASGSIFIGLTSRANASGEENQIVIGMNALGLGSNTVVLGNDNVVTTALKGNVGIGTTSPTYKLQVNANDAGLYVSAAAVSPFTQNIAVFRYGGNGNSINIENQGGKAAIQARLDNGTAMDLSINAAGGNVGIGTTSPAAKLHIQGNATDNVGLALFQNDYASGDIYFPAASFINTRGNHSYGIVSEFRINTSGDSDRPSILFYGAQASHSWQVGQVTSGWGTNDAFGIGYRASNDPTTFNSWPSNYFTILTGGNVGIGTSSPSYLLDVNGTARVTTLIETSALKYKTNIQPLEPQLSKVTQLEPVTFDWLNKPQTKTNIGLIADEVEKIYPEFVSKTEDGEIEGIEYSKLTTVLIQSIKELKEIVDQQQAQINKLLNK